MLSGCLGFLRVSRALGFYMILPLTDVQGLDGV